MKTFKIVRWLVLVSSCISVISSIVLKSNICFCYACSAICFVIGSLIQEELEFRQGLEWLRSTNKSLLYKLSLYEQCEDVERAKDDDTE